MELLHAWRLEAVGMSCPVYCVQGLYSQHCKPAAWLFPLCFGWFGLFECVNKHAASPVGQQVRMEQ